MVEKGYQKESTKVLSNYYKKIDFGKIIQYIPEDT